MELNINLETITALIGLLIAFGGVVKLIVTPRFNSIETRFNSVEKRLDSFDNRLGTIETHLTNHVTDTMKEISDMKERTKGLEKDIGYLKTSMDRVTAWIEKQS